MRRKAAAIVEHLRRRLALDLFGGALEPLVIYRIHALAEAYGIDATTTSSAIDDLQADRIAFRPLDGRVAFMPWTSTSMLQRARDLRYIASHSPVLVPPPAPLGDFRAAAGPSDVEVGLRFAARALDVPGHARTARSFERAATLFSAYLTIRAAEDPAIAEELRVSRSILVHLLDSPFESVPAGRIAPVDSGDQQVIVKRALVEYLREHERLHGLVLGGPSAISRHDRKTSTGRRKEPAKSTFSRHDPVVPRGASRGSSGTADPHDLPT